MQERSAAFMRADALSRSETREARDFAFVYICKSSARNSYHLQLSHFILETMKTTFVILEMQLMIITDNN